MNSIPFEFTVPAQKKLRLIIDTDAKNEADDQFAIVHALLTQKFDTKGIIAAHFGTQRSSRSMEESFGEISHVLELMDMTGSVPVFRGAPGALAGPGAPVSSEGAQAIIREALSGDASPLYCIFLGPLTDMASAFLLNPEIASVTNLTVIWIGGDAWPEGGPEFNMQNDPESARVIYRSGIRLWQIPRNVYNMVKVSLAELQIRVRPHGRIGEYLFRQMADFNDAFASNPGWPLGESWVLGDSAAIGVLLDQHEYCFHEVHAPDLAPDMRYVKNESNALMRMYHSVDTRFILEDMYAKLEIFADKS